MKIDRRQMVVLGAAGAVTERMGREKKGIQFRITCELKRKPGGRSK